MSPKTTINGVVDAIDVIKAFLKDLDFERPLPLTRVVLCISSAGKALTACALSADLRELFADLVNIEAVRYQNAVDIMNAQRAVYENKIRELGNALERERDFKARENDRKQKRTATLKLAFIILVYLLSGASIRFFGVYSFLAFIAAAAVDWKLSGDSSVFIALTRFFHNLSKYFHF